MAAPLDCDATAGQIRSTPDMLDGGLDRALHPVCGRRRGIAEGLRQAGDVRRLFLHVAHVVGASPNVDRRDIPATQSSTARPCARNNFARSTVEASAQITALPPPHGMPAAAALYVMPSAKRSASVMASSSNV